MNNSFHTLNSLFYQGDEVRLDISPEAFVSYLRGQATNLIKAAMVIKVMELRGDYPIGELTSLLQDVISNSVQALREDPEATPMLPLAINIVSGAVTRMLEELAPVMKMANEEDLQPEGSVH